MSSSIPFDRISVAPMMNYTNDYQRYLTRLTSKNVTLYTEMLFDDTLIHSTNVDNLLHYDPVEHPIIAQLGGSNKHKLLKVAKMIKKKGYDGINLNCGCPSPKVTVGSFGARLMLSPWRVYDIVQHLQNHVSIPITVKCRIGVDDHDSYEELVRFVQIVSGDAARAGELSNTTASDDDTGEMITGETILEPVTESINQQPLGVHHFIIHARKCLLKGLSTKQNRSIPPLQYDWVYRLLDDFPHLDFSINGGVSSLTHAQELIDRRSKSGRQVRGVMIGRLLNKKPWLFHYVDQLFYDLENPSISPYETIMSYISYCEQMQREGRTQLFSPNELLKPMFNLFTSCPGGCQFRRELHDLVCKKNIPLRGAVELALQLIPEDIVHNNSDRDVLLTRLMNDSSDEQIDCLVSYNN